MNITPIPNEPAIKIKLENEIILIVADLHIGIETAYRDAGANIPSQTNKMIKRLYKICKENNIKHLILLGDIKHTVPQTSYQELEEIPKLFYKLELIIDKIDIVLGNHDGNFKRYVPKVKNMEIKIRQSQGFTLRKIGFFHGHTWPNNKLMNCDHILMGHNHPNILFKDELGGKLFKPCWVRASFYQDITKERYPNFDPSTQLILLPAFNNLGTGTSINNPKQKLLGPILKNKFVDMDNARITLLDGTYLGKLKDLQDLELTKI
jgi:putative SbcD/Mre11-related phosphoesterase